ncbi:hypothetical protein MIND_00537900 [Mycena indigotica]|uniref:Uncharacterized protein n=1 Tax=Mycena indigotica TaxID=2126181 RepID=A0A8H6T0W5_9AGAR|nr:uncharacterized protein MIND_00537900 [Mycena indigotica]KAF7307435.1 hypothetical protein MIND_00537900 [Mycena indigotica]
MSTANDRELVCRTTVANSDISPRPLQLHDLNPNIMPEIPRMTRPRVPEKSHRGFVRVLAASPGPGLANYTGNPPPMVPRYRFGFITDSVILRGLTPPELHYKSFMTENYIEAQLKECCARHC